MTPGVSKLLTTARAVIMIWAALSGCGDGGSRSTGTPSDEGGTPSTTCAAFCDVANRTCGMEVTGCTGACTVAVTGRCGAQWLAVYQCGTVTKLTCDTDHYAHQYGCLSQLAAAGDCMF